MEPQAAPQAAPAAPTSPAPAAPAPTPAPAPAPAQDQGDDSEWSQAQDSVFGAKSTNNEVDKDEQPDPNKATEENPEGKEDPENPDDAEEPGSEEAVNEEAAKAAAAERAARHSAREFAQQVEAVKNDVRDKLFSDVPEYLRDGEGDPIRSVEDVMQLINPDTGKEFTREEAGVWFVQAQQEFNQMQAQVQKRIEQIAELNIDIKDQADGIKDKYASVLKARPELAQKLHKEFMDSLVRDPNSGIIIGMPLSLSVFYENALAPYAEADAAAAANAGPTPEEKAEADAKAQAEAAAKKQRNLADRSDIYAPTQTPATDTEEDEWENAAKNFYGNKL